VPWCFSNKSRLSSVNVFKNLYIFTVKVDNIAMGFENINTKKVLVIHGPNLNLLGMREPEIYGSETLDDINRNLSQLAENAGVKLETCQSNAEAELVDRVQLAMSDGTDFIIINPAAFTHTSVALRDALAAVKVPFIEIHLSNVYSRESFRRKSYFSDLAVGVISGLGAKGYALALEYALTSR
jgi:3-dehydroquinate dehydratase-2